jgi:hypothetical protein
LELTVEIGVVEFDTVEVGLIAKKDGERDNGNASGAGLLKWYVCGTVGDDTNVHNSPPK